MGEKFFFESESEYLIFDTIEQVNLYIYKNMIDWESYQDIFVTQINEDFCRQLIYKVVFGWSSSDSRKLVSNAAVAYYQYATEVDGSYYTSDFSLYKKVLKDLKLIHGNDCMD